MKPLELYIHIPFCVQKCQYCDFQSSAAPFKERQLYIRRLEEDIRTYKTWAADYGLTSIFVGGGTPSVLEPGQVNHIFHVVKETFTVCPGAEITIEVNPGTVSREKLKEYLKAGINRLSIGLQSADDRELKALGRIHTFDEFLETYQMARKEGFRNINVDLMSAIPHQTADSYRKTLRTVAELSPEHISAYSLMIEEGTPFYDRYGEGRHAEELPGEEEERQMYQDTKSILESYGYHRYEISNYAKEGFECRHNLGYWERAEYIGIGTGAASLVDHYRWVYNGEPEYLDEDSRMEEFMFLGLRKTAGVSREEFQRQFGRTMESVYEGVLKKMISQGLLEENEESVRLTEAGIDVSNYVMSEFLL